MQRSGRAIALLLALSLIGPARLAAQRRATLEVAPPTAPGTGALVTATNLFADADMRDLVRSGFPASLSYRLEAWSAIGLFDDLEERAEWQIIVQYDPSAERYNVVRRQGGRIDDLGSYQTLASAQAVIERPYRAPLVPKRPGTRYYYTLALTIEALSVSDMDQLERWLRGVRGGTAASAVGSGIRTLMLRMLGGEKRTFTEKSPSFNAP